MFEAAPGGIAGEQRCDLRERKNEDEVEKELERRDSLLALDRLRAHERTLTRFARRVSQPAGPRVQPDIPASRYGEFNVTGGREWPFAVMAGRPLKPILAGDANFGRRRSWKRTNSRSICPAAGPSC